MWSLIPSSSKLVNDAACASRDAPCTEQPLLKLIKQGSPTPGQTRRKSMLIS